MLFSLHTIPPSKAIQNQPGISFHIYVDDTVLYVYLAHKNVAQAFDSLKNSLCPEQSY